jgi:hypothetical protein
MTKGASRPPPAKSPSIQGEAYFFVVFLAPAAFFVTFLAPAFS